MCCFFTALVFFGPRLAILIWWLMSPVYIGAAFNTWIWPLLGFIFLPWTLLMFYIIYPGGIVGFDWIHCRSRLLFRRRVGQPQAIRVLELESFQYYEIQQ
jgi:hypothetical protein